MIAVTYIGANTHGLPENFPAAIRSDAISLLSGEHILMDKSAYVSWKASLDTENAEALSVMRNAVLLEAAADVIPKIKAEAQRRIVALLGYTPEQVAQWTAKQINMTAKGALLERKDRLGTITTEELVMLAQLEGFFAKVELIRAFSNSLESQWSNGQRPNIYAGWPE